jgi:t-SNARE complex subunit (syntaxin)
MTEYNDVQSKYQQKYRERVKRQFKIVKPDATEEEVQ